MPQMPRENAVKFFSLLFRGKHHIPGGEQGVKPIPGGWYVNAWDELSTFDNDQLTALVFLAHDKAVRVLISQSGPRRVKIVIFQRQRGGDSYDRHPTLEEAVEQWRKRVGTEGIV